jgi:hypothetical protein
MVDESQLYRLEVLLDERQAAEVLAGEVLPPRHLLPVRASSLRPHTTHTSPSTSHHPLNLATTRVRTR